MTSIVQLGDVKSHLNLSTISDDAELLAFIDAATPVVEKIAGPVIPQTFTEYFDGGRPAITLTHLPVISITSVIESAWGTNYTLTQVAFGSSTGQFDYTFDAERGRITRRFATGDGDFADGHSNIQVIYSAGRATIPANIRLATLNLIQHWWSQSQLNRGGGRPSFGGDDTSTYVGAWAVPNSVRELLQPDPQTPGVA